MQSTLCALVFATLACPSQTDSDAKLSASTAVGTAVNVCNAPTAAPLQEVIAGCSRLLVDPAIDRVNRTRVHLNRGIAYLMAGDFSAAETDFNQASLLDPGLILARVLRATTWVYMGDGHRAAEIAESVLSMTLNDASLLNARCWLRAAMNDLDSALIDCERSLAINPNNASTLDTRAMVRLKRMEYERALADYDAALQVMPTGSLSQRASSLFGRGVAERRLGNTAKGDQDIAAADALTVTVRKIYGSIGVVP